jgi:hypothetical protein
MGRHIRASPVAMMRIRIVNFSPARDSNVAVIILLSIYL